MRVVCAVAVILDHVSGEFRNAIMDWTPLGAANEAHVPVILLFNLLSKFAVPCFVMLSGAFLLADSRNRQFRYFYRKKFKNIGVPAIVFSLLYLLYSEAERIANIALGRGGIEELLPPVLALLRGNPLYHMWYLYAIAGVYLLVPVVIRLKDEIGERRFATVSWLFLLFAVPSGWTSTFILSWGAGKKHMLCGLSHGRVPAAQMYQEEGQRQRRAADRRRAYLRGCGVSGPCTECA